MEIGQIVKDEELIKELNAQSEKKKLKKNTILKKVKLFLIKKLLKN